MTPTEQDKEQPMTNYSERLDKIIDQLSDSSAARGWLDCKSGSEDTHPRSDLTSSAKQAITSLIKELVAEAEPGTWVEPKNTDDPEWQGYVSGINEFEQNLLKALEEV